MAVTSERPRFRLGSPLVSTVESVKTVLEAFDAYASKDFDRLAELYAEQVTWCCRHEPGPWDCLNRDDVLGMFRARMRRDVKRTADQILVVGHRVLVRGHTDTARFVDVYTVEDGRIVEVQTHPTTDAGLNALKSKSA
jgi:ketosteroid isomerase-like protein